MKSFLSLIIVLVSFNSLLANDTNNELKNDSRLKNMSAAARPQRKSIELTRTMKANEAVIVKNDTIIAYKPVFVEKKLKLPVRDSEVIVETSANLKP